MEESEMCSKVMTFLLALISLSWGEIFEMCSNPRCGQSSTELRCRGGFIQLRSLTFIFEKRTPGECCKMQSDCTAASPLLYNQLERICADKQSCSITREAVFKGVDDLQVNCNLDISPSIVSTKIEYNCIQDETTEALPATGNSDNTGQGGGSSALIVPIIIALAALIIIAAIFGVVIYRRQSRKKGNTGNVTQEQEIDNGERNTGFEDEYNTIPADYEKMPQHTYQGLGEPEANKDQMYTERRRDDSMKYSTIILYDQSETDNSNYDRTDQNKKYEANKLKDQENLHSYGHFSETSDSYSKLETIINRHNLDKDYSHFESDSPDDYSHLNDKKHLKNLAGNEYNHLLTKQNPVRPVKRVDSYEQPVFNGLSQRNDVLLCKPCEQQIDECETQVNEAKRSPLVNKMKRKDSYEKPVLLITNIVNEPQESFNTRDDYEAPISLKETSGNNVDVPTKRKDSYEKPVLKDVLEKKHNVDIKTKQDFKQEDKERLTENNSSDILFSNKTQMEGSYESPVLKRTVGMPDEPTVNMSDDNRKPLSLQASEYIPENVTTGTPTHKQVKRVNSYEKPELKRESGIDVSYKLQNERVVTTTQF